ncbi:MAG: penicillin-binding transpeptidase domain-containing protein, partial [Patescibacteria group bacterium]
YGRTEGEIDTVRAIARSTDTFFYKVGEFVGPERLAFWARKFGLGQDSGVDLPGEVSGLVPDPEWKLKTKGERWFLGNTYHMAIGQGDVAASPLQVNVMTSVVASGGKRCRPKVVQVEQVDQVEQGCEELGIGEETLKVIRKGMLGACATGGTAFPFFNFEPSVACKTGTAQTVGENTHAWLTAFGGLPNESGSGNFRINPNIVLTVLVEEGGEGSRVAGPVAREILQEWFSEQ